MYKHVYAQAYIYIHTYTYIHIYIYVYIYAYYNLYNLKLVFLYGISFTMLRFILGNNEGTAWLSSARIVRCKINFFIRA